MNQSFHVKMPGKRSKLEPAGLSILKLVEWVAIRKLNVFMMLPNLLMYRFGAGVCLKAASVVPTISTWQHYQISPNRVIPVPAVVIGHKILLMSHWKQKMGLCLFPKGLGLG